MNSPASTSSLSAPPTSTPFYEHAIAPIPSFERFEVLVHLSVCNSEGGFPATGGMGLLQSGKAIMVVVRLDSRAKNGNPRPTLAAPKQKRRMHASGASFTSSTIFTAP
jgi:hypothetical protein